FRPLIEHVFQSEDKRTRGRFECSVRIHDRAFQMEYSIGEDHTELNRVAIVTTRDHRDRVQCQVEEISADRRVDLKGELNHLKPPSLRFDLNLTPSAGCKRSAGL